MANTATAKVTFLRIAPRKVKIVLDLIRGKDVKEAEAILKYTPKAACEPVGKLLKSAVANAVDKDMSEKDLFVVSCKVDQGPTLKRMRPRAQGRGFRINKKTSHITLTVAERDVEDKNENKE